MVWPFPEQTDKLYPMLALGGTLGMWVGGVFLVGLLAAAFSSADSAMTALTTSTCVDLIGTEKMEEKKAVNIRGKVHIGVAVVLLCVIMILGPSMIRVLWLLFSLRPTIHMVHFWDYFLRDIHKTPS